jgi:hypothetical protein
VTGIEKGSLDPRKMEPFDNAAKYFRESLLLSEMLQDYCEVRLCENMYGANVALRKMLYELASQLERKDFNPPFGHSHLLVPNALLFRDKESMIVLEVELRGRFVRLRDIDSDGRDRHVAQAEASSVPILPVVWKDMPRDPSAGKRLSYARVCTLALARLEQLKEHLQSNAKLLSPDFESSLHLRPGYCASFLSPVSTPVPDCRVLEGCALESCTAQFAKFRCGKCFLARYCGAEHSDEHWNEHKKLCKPRSSRAHLEVSLGEVFCRQAPFYFAESCSAADVARYSKIEPVQGVVVVKVMAMQGCGATREQWIKVFDNTACFMIALEEKDAIFKQLMSFVVSKGEMSSCGHHSTVYCDADISVAGRMLLFTDKVHRCVW